MPYIEKKARVLYDGLLCALINMLRTKVYSQGFYKQDADIGHLNYCITKLITKAIEPKSYADMNEVIGVLESVKQEYYRRVVVPYENKKKKQNGDVL